ncbi:unnamed protein product [Polarella glacialis]|uniref:NarX-like N-terminal domain-containing protein n=1 Tax=Polarella glacialis TaxID=89957 RepID=A0A813DKZ9_POLGL|nr:unnamed protein product [Polarella glacialis]CAE8623034.1 unnamed protein product [Polarella glacialis]CAE8722107.1 unnamed protein product [Polarella glacialis]
MASSISLFDAGLTDLMNGNPGSGILASPSPLIQAQLQKVLDLWTPLKAVLENNVNSVRNSTGQVDLTILQAMAPGNVALLKNSAIAVGQLVDSAKAAGSVAPGLVVDIAGRQRMLIQRMCKEVLLIGLGFDVPSSLHHLKDSSHLFGWSHHGVIMGAPWAGVPELTSMCTIQAMSDVTHKWEEFHPFIEQILDAESDAESQATASHSAETIAKMSSPLFSSQVAAVKLYVNDTGLCTPLAGISRAQWVYLLNNVGKQRFLGQKVSQLFMQIANGVDVQNSKVSLSVDLASTTQVLRSLIEGSVVHHIPPPPTQAITDQLISAHGVWLDFRSVLQTAMDFGKTDHLTVTRVDHQSRMALNSVNLATNLYEEAALASEPTLPSHVINMAGRQRMLFQKISKEASLICYGEGVEHNWHDLNSSRGMFSSAHWVLLLGKLPDSDSPGINKTTDVCVIQQMKVVADLYGKLEQAALQTASGSLVALGELIKLNPVAFSAMNTAVGFYASGSASCGALNISFAEWTGVIREIGHWRMLSQKASKEFLLIAFGNYTGNYTGNITTADRNKLKATITEINLSLKRLKFGAGAHNIPAAPTQGIVDYVFALDGVSSSFIQALEADNISAVANKSETMLAETENVMTMYMEAAGQSDPTVPGHRMDIASRQLVLAQSIAKQALLLRLGFDGSSGAKLNLAMASFAASQKDLQYGGNGLEEVIPQRQDLLEQCHLVDKGWNAFRPQVQDIATASTNDTAAMSATLLALAEVLDAAVVLYGVLDPYVEIPELAVSWILIAMVVLLPVVLCGCVAVGVCNATGRSLTFAAMIGRCRCSKAKGLDETSV